MITKTIKKIKRRIFIFTYILGISIPCYLSLSLKVMAFHNHTIPVQVIQFNNTIPVRIIQINITISVQVIQFNIVS